MFREILLARAEAYLRSGRIGEPAPAFVQQIKTRAGDTLLGLRNRLDSGDPPLLERTG